MNQLLRKSSLRQRLLVLPLLFLGGMCVLELSNYYASNQVESKVTFPGFASQSMTGHSNLLKAAVEIEVAALGEKLKSRPSREEQIATIIAETDPIRFFEDHSGYFFTYDFTGVRINQPNNKTGNGKSFLELADTNGVRFIAELVTAAKNGGGFVQYHYEKPGQGVQPKLSYAQRIPGTDFLIGAGVYTDNVGTELARLHDRIEASSKGYLVINLVLFALILGVTVSASIWISESTRRPIQRIIQQLFAQARQAADSASLISTTSQTLAQGASEQAASIEEMSASLEEISSMTRRNAENARTAKDAAEATRKTTEISARDTKELGTAMNGIRQASGEMQDAMNGINAASTEVSKIIKTIDEIAFQTNLLALNAAVEAARAGEAGMGFAVVADEVRNLAQRSAHAARETTDRIEASLKRSEHGVQVIGKVNVAVEEVAAKSQQIQQRLDQVLASVQQVDEQIGQIANASVEQSTGISEISTSVAQMDKVTQSNAASAEESAASSEELNTQSEILKSSVMELQSLVLGAKASSHASASFNLDCQEASQNWTTNGGPAKRQIGKQATQPTNVVGKNPVSATF